MNPNREEILLAAQESSTGVLGEEPVRHAPASTLDLPEPIADETVGVTLERSKLHEAHLELARKTATEADEWEQKTGAQE